MFALLDFERVDQHAVACMVKVTGQARVEICLAALPCLPVGSLVSHWPEAGSVGFVAGRPPPRQVQICGC